MGMPIMGIVDNLHFLLYPAVILPEIDKINEI